MRRGTFKKLSYEEKLEKLKSKRTPQKRTTIPSKPPKLTSEQRIAQMVKELRIKMREIGCIESKMYKVPIKNIAWSLFSMYIRIRDFDKYGGKCYTCERRFTTWKEAQACHYISRGKAPTLYDEINVKIGCNVCNNPSMGNGMPRVFSFNLNQEHGLGTSDMLYQKAQGYIKNDFYFHYNIAEHYYQKIKYMV